MPDFNSPLGRRQLAMSAQQPRVLTVPDEGSEQQSQRQPPQPRANPALAQKVGLAKDEIGRLEEARTASREESRRISPLARERMELLLNIGRLQDDVEIEGYTFSIQSLKAGETKEVVKLASASSTTIESYFQSRQHTLAYAVYAIDGRSLDDILGDGSFEAVMQWLDNMDESVIEYLHTRYLEMIKKNKDKFSLATPEQAQEVADEVKKS